MRIVMTWLPWVIVLAFSLWWYGAFLGHETLIRVFGRIAGYWFLIGLIVVVGLIAAGRLGVDMGLPALFRDNPRLGLGLHSRAVWGAFIATYLIGLVWIIIYLFLYIDPANYQELRADPRPVGWNLPKEWAIPCQHLANFRDCRSVFGFLMATTPPFLVLLLAIGICPDEVIGAPSWNGRRATIGSLEYLVGIALGVLAVCALVGVAWLLLNPIASLRDWIGIEHLRNWIWKPRQETQIERLAFSMVWAVLAANAILAIYPIVRAKEMTPSFGIGTLLCLIALGYLFIMAAPRPFRVPTILLIVIYVGWSNSGTYKYRFPGIEKASGASYYDKANLDTPDKLPGDPAMPLLRDVPILDAWKARLNEDKPKLVLLALSGGGSRASFWTATVIDELERRSGPTGDLPGLSDRIRLMTGASGGMVGASYYARLRADGKSPANVVETMANETQLDSLSLVVQQLVQSDIPLIFVPLSYQVKDRGTVFEDQWKLLDRAFSDLRGPESNGSIPSLIVSPMIVETGERLLISNLDVDALVTPMALSKVKYSSSGRVFFRRFPGAQGTFKLKTAARMSASFPYVLPAVSLPTNPPARIVDAGYYDNFGVNLAAAWAYQNREWIKIHTSGVALIQVNAFPRGSEPVAKTTPDGVVAPLQQAAPPAQPATAGDVAEQVRQRAFEWLTSPIEGGMAARDWSMYYRNEEQIRLLDDTFNQNGERLFERFSFTNTGHAAMNVIITDEDIALMKDEFSPPPNNPVESDNIKTMKQLVAWWKGEQIDAKDKVSPMVPSQLYQMPR